MLEAKFIADNWKLIAIAAPVAVQCPELPKVSKRMMEPAKNAYLTQPSSKTQQTTPTK